MNTALTIPGVKKIIRKAAAEANRSRTIMISDIKDDRFLLNRPIPVFLEYEGDSVIANYYDTESFGYGETEYEALNALCRELVETYIDLETDIITVRTFTIIETIG